MSDDDTVAVRRGEDVDLYVLLLSRESTLPPTLEALKLRLERSLYRDHSIEEMERIAARAGNGRS
ncbi:MAG: hypothetical protein ACOCV0_01060 [Alkalispirochaeta sp.]